MHNNELMDSESKKLSTLNYRRPYSIHKIACWSRIPKNINNNKTKKFTIGLLKNFGKYVAEMDLHYPIKILESYYPIQSYEILRFDIKIKRHKHWSLGWSFNSLHNPLHVEHADGVPLQHLKTTPNDFVLRVISMQFKNCSRLELLDEVTNLIVLWVFFACSSERNM